MKNNIEAKFFKLFVLLLAFLIAITGVMLVRQRKELSRIESQQQMIEKEEPVSIDISLPDTVYVATGMTMEIYNSQVTNFAQDISKYNILWRCEVGENLERKFSVKADETNLGSYDLTLEIYDNRLRLVAEQKCILKIVEVDAQKKEASKKITTISETPEQCIEQVMCSIDMKYNGTVENLKPEGVLQLQDIICAVLCGI